MSKYDTNKASSSRTEMILIFVLYYLEIPSSPPTHVSVVLIILAPYSASIS